VATAATVQGVQGEQKGCSIRHLIPVLGYKRRSAASNTQEQQQRAGADKPASQKPALTSAGARPALRASSNSRCRLRSSADSIFVEALAIVAPQPFGLVHEQCKNSAKLQCMCCTKPIAQESDRAACTGPKYCFCPNLFRGIAGQAIYVANLLWVDRPTYFSFHGGI
jgi:hypothetical protein